MVESKVLQQGFLRAIWCSPLNYHYTYAPYSFVRHTGLVHTNKLTGGRSTKGHTLLFPNYTSENSALVVYICSLVWPFLPTHCRCRVLLLHLITHKHSGQVVGPSQRPLPDNTRSIYPRPRRNSNPQSQEASGRRPTASTTRPPGFSL